MSGIPSIQNSAVYMQQIPASTDITMSVEEFWEKILKDKCPESLNRNITITYDARELQNLVGAEGPVKELADLCGRVFRKHNIYLENGEMTTETPLNLNYFFNRLNRCARLENGNSFPKDFLSHTNVQIDKLGNVSVNYVPFPGASLEAIEYFTYRYPYSQP